MDENHVYLQPSHDTSVLQYTDFFLWLSSTEAVERFMF